MPLSDTLVRSRCFLLERERGWGSHEEDIRKVRKDLVIMTDPADPLSNPFMLVQGDTSEAELEAILHDDLVWIRDITGEDDTSRLPERAQQIFRNQPKP